MAKFYLGVDGGGTYTKATIVDPAGKIVSQNQSAGSNANVYGHKVAAANLSEAVRQVIDNLHGEVFGCLAISGINFKNDRTEWQKSVDGDNFLKTIFTKPPLIINDAPAALRSGTTDKNSLVIIAGTGSNCYGQNENGQEAKSGGVDYILSDEGGGYWLGLEVLKSVTKAQDGRGEMTSLVDLVFTKFNIDSFEKLYTIVYQKPWNKTEIAQVAAFAEEAAEKGDSVAERIVDKAANELALMIRAVASKLQLINRDFTIVKAGSILKIERMICKKMKEKTKEFAPHAVFVDQNVDSANGAALLALEKFS